MGVDKVFSKNIDTIFYRENEAMSMKCFHTQFSEFYAVYKTVRRCEENELNNLHCVYKDHLALLRYES